MTTIPSSSAIFTNTTASDYDISRITTRPNRDRDNGSRISSEEIPQTELRPDLKERHVNMIAFSTCLGIGLFLQSGHVTSLAGPGLAIFAYIIAGTVMWCIVSSLGEMTALFPMSGGLFIFPARFLDEAVGFAAGWMAWFSWVVIIAAELLAVAQLFRFYFEPSYLKEVGFPREELQWNFGLEYTPAVWVTIFWFIALGINCLPVVVFGRLEYIFGCLKMVFLVGLIMFNVVINAMKIIPHDNKSQFWTYDSPYGFTTNGMTISSAAKPNKATTITGSTGIFLAFWSGISTTIFSMVGIESVSITAGENRDLAMTETVKIASRKIGIRVILLYTLATFAGGLNVPFDDGSLVNHATSIRSGQNSIFVIAAVRNHFVFWPQFFAGFFIFCAASAGINSVYLSSRILHSLASTPEVWPQWSLVQKLRAKLERTAYGVPHAAVFTSWLFGVLGYLSASADSAEHLGRIARNSVVSMLIVYTLVCLSFLVFHNCLEQAAAQSPEYLPDDIPFTRYDRNRITYPYKSRGQRFCAWYGFVGGLLLALFQGWAAFVSPVDSRSIVANYISIPVFFLIVVAYRIMLQGWNPGRWKRRATKQMDNPVPLSVQRKDRRGRLRLPDYPKLLTMDNLYATVGFLITWIK